MAKITGTSSKIYKELFRCPACKRDIDATVEVEIDLETSGTDGELTGRGRVTGLRVEHNCIKAKTRESVVARSGGQVSSYDTNNVFD